MHMVKMTYYNNDNHNFNLLIINNGSDKELSLLEELGMEIKIRERKWQKIIKTNSLRFRFSILWKRAFMLIYVIFIFIVFIQGISVQVSIDKLCADPKYCV